jgi:hypothetical protein
MFVHVRQLVEVVAQVRQFELQLGQLVPLLNLPGEHVKHSVLDPPLQVRQLESQDKHCLTDER